jgi:hypothetical protein
VASRPPNRAWSASEQSLERSVVTAERPGRCPFREIWPMETHAALCSATAGSLRWKTLRSRLCSEGAGVALDPALPLS